MLSLPAFESRDARIAHYEDVVAFLAPIFAKQTRDHWTAELTRLEVPNSPVYDSAEVLATEQAKVLGIEVSDPNGPKGTFRTIRFPLSFDGERMDSVTAPPLLGADDAAVRRSIERPVHGIRRG
jgi:crotonobetainyl-CoA:carnitine CoA-transferase CaiB-like acyl-CoA transferase